jgi:hypothetical protein
VKSGKRDGRGGITDWQVVNEQAAICAGRMLCNSTHLRMLQANFLK